MAVARAGSASTSASASAERVARRQGAERRGMWLTWMTSGACARSGEHAQQVTVAGGRGRDRVAALRCAVLLDVEVLHPRESSLREDALVVDLPLADRDYIRRTVALDLGFPGECGQARRVLHVPHLEAPGRLAEQLPRVHAGHGGPT